MFKKLVLGFCIISLNFCFAQIDFIETELLKYTQTVSPIFTKSNWDSLVNKEFLDLRDQTEVFNKNLATLNEEIKKYTGLAQFLDEELQDLNTYNCKILLNNELKIYKENLSSLSKKHDESFIELKLISAKIKFLYSKSREILEQNSSKIWILDSYFEVTSLVISTFYKESSNTAKFTKAFQALTKIYGIQDNNASIPCEPSLFELE